ncbi:MAG TPA: isoprenylcysteine carboxylmethyltransferase family protein [Vicinamibacteria bacterium]
MARHRLGRAAVGAAAFFVVAPGGVAGLAPYLISGWRLDRRLPGGLRVLGAVLIAAAVLSVAESFVRFVARGHGTPAPVSPPRHLVVSGQYRYLRNPMYLSLVAIVVGQAVWFGSAALAAYAAVLLGLFHLRVVTCEEPRLSQLFGGEFASYRRAVPRWLPRLGPWRPSRPGSP